MTASVLDDRTPLTSGGSSPAPAAPAAPAPSAAARELDLNMQAQAETEWCWAAVSTSIALFFRAGSPWTQCTVVNAELEQTTCCQDGGSAACNVPWYLERGLARVGHLAKDFGGSQDMAAVAAQVDAGRPMGLCIDWTGGGGHFVMIDGYDQAAGMIDVKDPLFGPSYVSLASFPARYQGGGTWSWTYLTS